MALRHDVAEKMPMNHYRAGLSCLDLRSRRNRWRHLLWDSLLQQKWTVFFGGKGYL